MGNPVVARTCFGAVSGVRAKQATGFTQHMAIRLARSLATWNSPAFADAFKAEIRHLDKRLLPLQASLLHSSHVSDSPIEPVILTLQETADLISIKTGIFYSGIIAGSCCADDPTPICEENEYCVLLFEIDKQTGQTAVKKLET